MKKLLIFLAVIVVLGCGEKSSEPERAEHTITLGNQSDLPCVVLSLENSGVYHGCDETTSYIGRFEETSWAYSAWITVPANVNFPESGTLVGSGSMFLSGDRICIFYNDSLVWQ